MKQILLSLIILIIIITIILLFYSIKYKKEKFLNFDFVPESIDFVKKNGAFYENQPIYSDDNPANNYNNKIVIELPEGTNGSNGQPAVCRSDCSNPDACNGSSCKGQPGDPGIPKCLIKAGEPGLQGFAGRKGNIGVKGKDIQPIQAPRGRQGPPGKTGNPGISYATLHGQNGQKGASGAMGLDAIPQYMDNGTETQTKVLETNPGEIFELENKKPIDFMSNSVEGEDVVLGYNLGDDNRDNFDIEKDGYVTEKQVNDIGINLSVPYMQILEFELSISGEISFYQDYNYFTINIPNFEPPFDNYKDMLIFCSWDIDDSLAVYHKNSNDEIQMITDIVTDTATDTPNSYWYNTDESEKFTTKIKDNNKIYIYYKTQNLVKCNKAKIICFYFNNN